MIKNPKLLAVCLIVANVFFFGAYAYVTDGEIPEIHGRAFSIICFCAVNLIATCVYNILNLEKRCPTSSTP